MASNLVELSRRPVAVPNYRLSPRHPPPPDSRIPSLKHPTHTQDIVLALEHIRNSDELSSIADNVKMLLVGHSCGAHMIATLMLDPPEGEGINLNPPLAEDVYDLISGLVVAEGIYDLTLLLETFPSYRDFVEGAFPQFKNLNEFSVSRYRSRPGKVKPWLVLQSPDDKLIDIPQAETMYQHLRSEYERLGWSTNLIRRESDTLKGDHDEVLSTLEFAKLVVSAL